MASGNTPRYVEFPLVGVVKGPANKLPIATNYSLDNPDWL